MTALTSMLLLLMATFLNGKPTNSPSPLTIDEVIETANEDAGFKVQKFGNTSLTMKDPMTVVVDMDMLYPLDEYLEMKQEMDDECSFKSSRTKRKARIPAKRYRWTDGVIPYEISKDYYEDFRNIILESMGQYEKYSCVKFVPAKSNHKNKVQILQQGFCASSVGMIGGTQTVDLGPTCFDKRGVVVHELGHVIGFVHEHMRPDRDEFIEILFKNIGSGKAKNFCKYTLKQVDSYGVPYDYTSVMHYGQTNQGKFKMSRRGLTQLKTMISKDEKYQKIMGQRDGLSFKDIKLVNLMYECSSKCKPQKCPPGGFLSKDCKCWCDGGDIKNPVKLCNSNTKIEEPKTLDKCQDRIDCSNFKTYCSREAVRDFAKSYCEKTCGFCT